MKKLLLLLIIPVFILFLNTNYTSASYLSDTYGNHLTFTTLSLYTDFDFTEEWWKNGYDVCVFEFRPVEESLEEFMRALPDYAITNFMEVYHYENGTYEYITSTGGSPTDDIGWTVEDGFLYLMIKESWFTTECDFSIISTSLIQEIYIDTWIFTESTDNYELGYNNGYIDGINSTLSKLLDLVPLILILIFVNGIVISYLERRDKK